MNKPTEKKTAEKILEAIFALDLEPIKFKLMDKQEGQGWSKEQVDFYELEYKRFLALLVKYPDTAIAPNTNVDKFWHGHILDTMKYAEDCDKVFGHFLHHYPYFGMRGEEDAANLVNAFESMQQLYEREFGYAERTMSNPQTSAWCAAPNVKAEEKAAWCAAPNVKAEEKAAWCAAPNVKAGEKVAWCAAPNVKAEEKAAWCAAPNVKAEEKAAWCAAPNVKAGEKAAWCAASVIPPDQTPAWCAAPNVKAEEKAAWCAAPNIKFEEKVARRETASGHAS